MSTPIESQWCASTGRMLTEWFEYPELTDAQIRSLAFEYEGLSPEEGKLILTGKVPDKEDVYYRLKSFVAGRKNRKWANNMSQQEVAMRMNEASKFVDPANQKMLDQTVQDRTGLELNPLWMMETLIRSGVLSPKEQIAALKELATYTHSKAPTLNHNMNTNSSPEDWLLDLAKSEFTVVGEGIPLPAQRTAFEHGSETTPLKTEMAKKRQAVESLHNRNSGTLASLEAMMDAEVVDVSNFASL